MANYTYRVMTKSGKEKKGTIEADTRDKALAQLRNEGNSILEIKEGTVLNTEIHIGGFKPASKDLMVFCRQFNALLRAGVSIVESLDMLADQTENKTLSQSIKNVHDNVQKGDGLAVAMRRETNSFPPLLVNMVEAGEASGNLENSLARMAVHFEKDNKVKGMVTKAMIYPIMLMVVAIGVLVLMVVVVIPKFSAMFDDLGGDLPWITKALLNFSDSLINYWFIYILAIAAIVFGIIFFKRSETGTHFFARLAIKLPVFGKLTVKTAAARFSRTFSTMLSSGMPMVEAMNITANTMDNVLFKEALEETSLAIQQGQPLQAPLKKSGLFPSLIYHMVGIGEESGNLEEMLENCAVYYDEEVEIATQQVMALMEPMIIIVLALIVIVILAAIYGPMIQLYNTMGAM